MKKSLVLLTLIISFSGLAQEMTCLDKLLPFNRHSGLHQVTKDEWTDGKENFDAESVRAALTFLTNSKLLCKTGEVGIRMQPECSNIITDIPQSLTCFVYTNVGHFTVTRDSVRNLNFIFTRDRRFAD
jgi:hypothetical protein